MPHFTRTDLAPLVGREEELSLLLRRWHQAKQGNGQVVLLTGEPGIGKSRLIAELEDRLCGEQFVSLRYFCSPHHQEDPLYPVIERWTREAGFTRDDSPAAKFEKLDNLLAPTDTPAEEVALIADLLGIPAAGHYPPLEFSPQRKRERTFEALVRRLTGRTREQPVLLLFEDIHWADSSSRELLDMIIGLLSDLRLLLVASFRSEFAAPWVGRPETTVMALSRLNRRHAMHLAAQVAAGQTMGQALLERVVVQTDGVPLFIEELTKAMLETPSSDDLRLVCCFRARNAARLPDGASGSTAIGRYVAQVGAVIGRDFSHGLLQGVAQLPKAQLAAGINELVGSGLVLCRGTPPDAVLYIQTCPGAGCRLRKPIAGASFCSARQGSG